MRWCEERVPERDQRHYHWARMRAGERDDTAQAIDTQGGRMHVRWDAQAAATPHGQLVPTCSV